MSARMRSSARLRISRNVQLLNSQVATKAAPTESLPQLQPGVVEAGSSDQQQQTLEVFVAEQPVDGSSTFSDMSVEDPPTFEELGVDKLLVVSMHVMQWLHMCMCADEWLSTGQVAVGCQLSCSIYNFFQIVATRATFGQQSVLRYAGGTVDVLRQLHIHVQAPFNMSYQSDTAAAAAAAAAAVLPC
jgi:hypothetical protein